ncbi:bis(5'-nucleosyl)-tetraphosphatase PrpE [asymmetrical]-like [Ylistrum balloti]|uniref:bis(5'-nucleosyl)-tetraphosphatase PrpE [asymmetrical]-like n=1 Tax=Ylistrum balloti TaxID=509963 RepID=UPI002905E49D|nr:bis(5'-nucleosyl)-tetraphosphatase PrpE [asymmetrical]-like [Ylistrum balloti]
MAGLVAYICSFIFKSSTKRSSKHNLPLPVNCHIVLDDDVIGDKSIFIIGDVHGCYDELLDLLSLAQSVELDRSILPVFVGDLINKGPKSVEVLHKIKNMDGYAVRGNHDEAVLRQLLNRRNDPDYVYPPKYNWCKGLTDSDVDFLTELPYTIAIPACNALLVHAGLVPGIPVEKQNLTDMIVMRNVERNEDGSFRASESRFVGKQWASQWSGPEHVYFGHDAVRGFQDFPFATGLDTGCLYGKELTGVFINGCLKRLSVKARRAYRPP